ncbi:hypothetical protein GM415_05465 [Pseudodesulfovibrio cashew]|uniref:TPM domain-containing protein n=1 Tax=Pseudodesulfovibrio cashew TaxID=2678688 RepID=A0A6I6JHL3_9BACT|nr:TPM domain-containing protein [Pseudodesulfovibrio cashew]QGY39587.1 hypothetical protein GM415_05465 [Pseudodesulfovibrio cashew]
MRKVILFVPAALLVLVFASGAKALDVPEYKGYVNDLAGMISPKVRQTLEARLADLDRTDSTQIAVLTVPSLEGEDINDFSIRVTDAWKIGQKNEDNGVLLLVSKADRKLRIEVGYGLEGVLTDVLSGQIITNVIAPRFKAGDYDSGFLDGVGAISGAVRGEFKAAPVKTSRRSGRGALPLIIIPMILFVALTEIFGRRRRAARMSGWDGLDGQHGRSSAMGSAASTLFWLSLLGGGHRGGGGGFGGGGFGDGGGFGGFGGGGFGGGGASGDW